MGNITKTQTTVLQALACDGMIAQDYEEAQSVFDFLGIEVKAVRQGRATLPQITVLPRATAAHTEGAATAEGEGETWEVAATNDYPIYDFSPILDWVTNEDEAEAISAAAQAQGAGKLDMAFIRQMRATNDRERRLAYKAWKRNLGA